MRTWKTTFAFITGILLMHLVGHLWLALEGMLPFTSRVLNLTITDNLNNMVMLVNALLLIVCGYYAFLHDWEGVHRVHRHA